MTYSISNHILYQDGKPVNNHPTRKTSGKMKPRYIVIHYTAGVNFAADVRTLSTSKAQVSCQLVLSPEGEWAQVGELNDIQWHAGKSRWDGISGLNSHSIGIEVTCPGWLRLAYEEDGVKYFKHSVGNKVMWNDRDDDIVQEQHQNGGPVQYWLRFTEAQMEALREAVPVIMDHYGIIECVGHDMIAPDRKIDPGPCLPDGFYDFVNGRKHDSPSENGCDQSTQEYDYKVFNTRNTGLNIRKWPASTSQILKNLPEGTMVDKIRIKGAWWMVETEEGLQGWVHSKFLTRI